MLTYKLKDNSIGKEVNQMEQQERKMASRNKHKKLKSGEDANVCYLVTAVTCSIISQIKHIVK
jgi:hypothetical protein